MEKESHKSHFKDGFFRNGKQNETNEENQETQRKQNETSQQNKDIENGGKTQKANNAVNKTKQINNDGDCSVNKTKQVNEISSCEVDETWQNKYAKFNCNFLDIGLWFPNKRKIPNIFDIKMLMGIICYSKILGETEFEIDALMLFEIYGKGNKTHYNRLRKSLKIWKETTIEIDEFYRNKFDKPKLETFRLIDNWSFPAGWRKPIFIKLNADFMAANQEKFALNFPLVAYTLTPTAARLAEILYPKFRGSETWPCGIKTLKKKLGVVGTRDSAVVKLVRGFLVEISNCPGLFVVDLQEKENGQLVFVKQKREKQTVPPPTIEIEPAKEISTIVEEIEKYNRDIPNACKKIAVFEAITTTVEEVSPEIFETAKDLAEAFRDELTPDEEAFAEDLHPEPGYQPKITYAPDEAPQAKEKDHYAEEQRFIPQSPTKVIEKRPTQYIKCSISREDLEEKRQEIWKMFEEERRKQKEESGEKTIGDYSPEQVQKAQKILGQRTNQRKEVEPDLKPAFADIDPDKMTGDLSRIPKTERKEKDDPENEAREKALLKWDDAMKKGSIESACSSNYADYHKTHPKIPDIKTMMETLFPQGGTNQGVEHDEPIPMKESELQKYFDRLVKRAADDHKRKMHWYQRGVDDIETWLHCEKPERVVGLLPMPEVGDDLRNTVINWAKEKGIEHVVWSLLYFREVEWEGVRINAPSMIQKMIKHEELGKYWGGEWIDEHKKRLWHMKNELQLDERRKEEQKERDKDKITYAPKEVEDEFLTELEGLPDGLQRELWDKATEQNQICAPGMQRHRYITGAWELINDRRNGSAFDKNVLERWRDFPVPDLPFPKLKK